MDQSSKSTPGQLVFRRQTDEFNHLLAVYIYQVQRKIRQATPEWDREIVARLKLTPSDYPRE